MPYTSPASVSAGTTITSAWGNSVKAGEDYIANPPACRVYHNAAISIAHNTTTVLGSTAGTTTVFNQERYKTVGTMHSTVTNPGRITVPDAGLYVVGANIAWASAAGNTTRLVQIRHNGTTIIAGNQIDGATGAQVMPVETIWKCAASDFFEVVVYHFQGAALNVSLLTAYSPEFWAVWMGLG